MISLLALFDCLMSSCVLFFNKRR